MSPEIQRLADQFGIQLEDRCCGGHDLKQPVWNGKTLATKHLRVKYDGRDEVVSRWEEPLSDHDFLHEIGHWLAAFPEQKDLSEYGLGAVAFSTYHFYHECPTIVDKDEAGIQEFLAQLLSIHWGQKYNLSPKLSSEPTTEITTSWETYLSYKIQESIKYNWTEDFWKALIRFQAMRERGDV